MAFDRPTFSESWYRVAELKPRLRTLVQAYRQHYRGDQWMVLRDPGNNKFYRLDDANYRMIGLLDGRRSVDAVWQQVQEELGDRAPTQGEAIQLLGQLFTSNLIEAEVPADAAGMFERYRKRKKREIGGYFLNLLFARIPIFDPEPILVRWNKVFGWLFGPVGLALWVGLVAYGLFSLAPRSGELFGSYLPGGGADGVLSPANLPYLYIMLVLTKLVHEFGHGFCCKYYGLRNHSGGEVHTLGIMLMAFMPLPYVDASSSWAFRNKWQRAFVGAAGMYVEIAMAAVAAVVWVNTADNTLAHKLAYNVIFIAGVSTLLFNANPLIRFDGYYILSDLLEMPNLAQRSKEYTYYLVKKYVYKVQRPRDPSHGVSERWMLLLYSFASAIYRVFITVAILLFVMSFDIFFFIGAVAGIMGVVSFVIVPVGKWWHYVLTNPEVQRTRPRAIVTTALFFVAVITLFGLIPLPEHGRASGVVEPAEVRVVYAQTEGFIQDVAHSGRNVAEGETLFQSDNRILELRLDELRAELSSIDARLNQVIDERPVDLALLDQRRNVVLERIAEAEKDLASLASAAPFAGEWVVGQMDGRTGHFVRVGDPVGMLVTNDRVFIRVSAGQAFGPRLVGLEGESVTLRVRGRAGQFIRGTVTKVDTAGSRRLASEALGFQAGGDIEVTADERTGEQSTTESLYEVDIKLDDAADARALLSGQRVVARFDLGTSPIAVQAWRMLVRAYRERRQA